ncbi:hypothetical protein CBR_g29463 [Chara braunii]|uniref:Uncharacterized protein n=1 Tax=Chara braunii TaxID=69332 RepID=A0A388LAL2_CHABU|nr:hypothetical protein CBR_g29463 [Chara braunii]|eukprot:GBG79314.1 hypothetical protein CBR_g29463 [Chara braunii]
MCAEYRQAKVRSVPFVPPPPLNQSRSRRTMTIGTERQSHLADTATPRVENNKANDMMHEYFLQMALERRERIEREARELEQRREKEARLERERRRQKRLEEKRQYEEERDERLLRKIREEVSGGYDSEASRKFGGRPKYTVKRNEYSETREDEKEWLLRTIASLGRYREIEEEDKELVELRRRVAGLRLGLEKRKRPVVEGLVGNNPPMMTPTKEHRTRLSKEVKTRIEEIQNAEAGKEAESSVTKNILASLEPTGNIGLSLKHVTTDTGPGAREKYERDIRYLYEALTVDELKDQCKIEKISYGNRDLAIKCLVIRQIIKAYDPVDVPLPDKMRDFEHVAKRNTILNGGDKDTKASSSEEDV